MSQTKGGPESQHFTSLLPCLAHQEQSGVSILLKKHFDIQR